MNDIDMKKGLEDATGKKRTGKRSPGYPLLTLEEAIQKAKLLWDKDKNSPIPIEAAYSHLGYSTTTGYAARVLAALKKFNLIYEKQNNIILTDEAIDLALHDPSSETYINIVRNIALKPTIYEKLYNEYNGKLPSDATLKIKLIKELDFNPNRVNGFLTDFRKTIEYAQLSGGRDTSLNISPTVHAISDTGIPKMETQAQAIQTGVQAFPIPLSKMKKAFISFESLPINKKDIEAIKAWLKLFEGSLTGIDDPETPETEKEES